MTAVGQHADRVGAVFAVETGSESGATLRGFIESVGAVGIRATIDPANLLIKGYDPVQAVRDLNEFIVHAYARDAIREGAGELGREATPGDGDLDWNEYFGAMEEVHYHGWHVIRREQAPNVEREVGRSVSFLSRF
jgi:L-ribulose-5-phosphate 3-epimerase